jgi:hypothetical protein
MTQRMAAVAVAFALFTGLTQTSQAAPAMQGSTASSAGPFTPCTATCAPFFQARCSSDMAKADGLTTSIIDVQEWAGRSLTFSWADLSTTLYDELDPYVTPPARVFFYFVDSCAAPSWFSFVLTSKPAERTKQWKIPHGSKWLIVESADVSAGMRWWAS